MSKRVAIFLGDGFEDMEVIAPTDCLRRAGVDVTLVSVMPTKAVKSAQGVDVTANAQIDEADLDLMSFDMIVVPGGNGGVDNINACQKALDTISAFMHANKHVGSICAGPTILAGLGLLEGRIATCYPGCQTNFPAGVYQADFGVYVDGNLITASGPGQAMRFGIALAKALVGEDVAKSVSDGLLMQPVC